MRLFYLKEVEKNFMNFQMFIYIVLNKNLTVD